MTIKVSVAPKSIEETKKEIRSKSKKKITVKHKIKKSKKRRERAILKDRVLMAEMEVAKAIMHLKFHEIQLAKHERRQNYPDLADEYRDAKDTYERLLKRAAFPHKKVTK